MNINDIGVIIPRKFYVKCKKYVLSKPKYIKENIHRLYND